MGTIGPHNPYPFVLGGGQTETERIYAALRSAVGKGGSAEDDQNTIDGLWRFTKARGIAQVSPTGERAARNALPERATDLIGYYEDLLAVRLGTDATDEDRRTATTQRFTERIRSTVPDIEEDLFDIDPRFSVLDVPDTQSETTQYGRAFQDLAATEPFNGGRKSTLFPNVSSEYVVFVLFGIGAAVTPSIAEQLLIEDAKAHLNRVLPAWVTFQITTSTGFILDTDLLDLTGLSP